jgi:hypothetical protein
MNAKIKRIYSCVKCSGRVEKPPCVAPGDKNKKGATIRYNGLHGWICENCGTAKRFVSVTRDLSGGKEGDKGNREVSIKVSRPLQVKVTLENMQ